MIASLTNMGCTPGEAYAFGQSAVATITPTVTVTPIATDQYSVFLPLIEKQVVIPGSLSIEDVYTTDYEGDRQMTYQPCQAVALWTRMRNEADIPQPAILHWRTMAPTEEEHGNLGGRRQVYVPPGESVWRFLGAPDLDAPAGEYQWQAWFTSGIDRHGLEGTIIVEGQSVPTRYLEALTAKIDPENYTFTVSRVIVPGRAYATYPARPADVFTPEDDFVVQTILWEGVKPDTAIFTRRYRPSGRPWGNANYGFRGYETHPGCVRRQNLYWHVEDMEDKPGEWRLKFSTDEGATWQGGLTFTLTE
ncbi:MAG: hypothetical protein MAG451_01943 [Anaerolineales bacterium]|nr:hypothetical protein [Anaerolineales bacterium]